MPQVLLEGKHLLPTAAGAYYCASTKGDDTARKLLQWLMGKQSSSLYSMDDICKALSLNETHVEQLLRHMQHLSWLQCTDEKQLAIPGKLEDILPDILPGLSHSGKVLLADAQGFYIASAGFPHETAEELSGLSADLMSLSERHQGVLGGNLNIKSNNWALVDAGGFSQLGCWPVNIGQEIFSLVIAGLPRFDRDEFLQLVWTLYARYGSNGMLSGEDVAKAS